MLKFVIMVMLMSISPGWGSVQALFFAGTFLMMVFLSSDFFLSYLGSGLGIDNISYSLILLSFWVMSLIMGASQSIYKMTNFPYLFSRMNIFLLLSLILAFSSLNYMLFYIFFEASLIPTLILILGWGYQPERMQAGIYMLFYTLFSSLPLLVSLASFYYYGGSLTFNLTDPLNYMSFSSMVWYFCTIFAFLVKLPMFSVHLWLPKAHVEAPVAGSMILAAVLLKLGGYGVIRLSPIFLMVSKSFSWIWVSFGVMGGGIVGVMCLRQNDMKALIAYSSVAHMGLVLCGLVLAAGWGTMGAVVVMIGHGLCSSGLFCMANMVYERIGSRSLFVSKGLLTFMPSMCLWWFLLSAGNMAAPPTLNLVGEISLIIGLMTWSSITSLSISLLCFFSAAYTLYLFSMSQHGKFFNSLFSCCSGQVREYLILMLHWLPLNVVIMKVDVLTI